MSKPDYLLTDAASKMLGILGTLHKNEGEHVLNPSTLEEGKQYCGNRSKENKQYCGNRKVHGFS